jgi:glutamine kinase
MSRAAGTPTHDGFDVVVLGAGPPHRGTVPPALRSDRAGTPVLEWLVDALDVDLRDVTFVGGYAVEDIRRRYPTMTVLVRPDWERTGSAGSLLSTPLRPDRETVVTYSDVLIRRPLVEALRTTDAAVVVAWDSHWRGRYEGRTEADLAACEKVVVADGQVLRLGVDIALDAADGEFVGVVHLRPAAVQALDRVRDGAAASTLRRGGLPDLLQQLVDAGVDVAAVDVAGDWAEIDAPQDIARFVLGTKADTLARLQRMVRSARIADQVTFTVAEWQRDHAACLAAVAARFDDRPLIVRSSSTHEDAFHASNAGGFSSVLGVRVGDGLDVAVERVVASYGLEGAAVDGQQVLVQPLIEDVVASGVALTRTLEHGSPWTVVEFTTDGDTEAVTSGGSADHRTLYVRRDLRDVAGTRVAGASGAASSDLALVAPVLTALGEVEQLLGYDALDVEFALDAAGDVHLLQVRPLVTGSRGAAADATVRAALEDAHRTWSRAAVAPAHLPGAARPVYGVMPDWNPAEIIGVAPGALALSLYRRLVTDDVWATQRAEYGYRDVRPAPLLAVFAGRPYVDVRASFASFLPAGLDEGLAGRLLEASLERLVADPSLHDKVEFTVVPTCVDPDWVRWKRLLRAEGFATSEVEELAAALRRITLGGLGRVEDDVARVRELERRQAQQADRSPEPLARAGALLDEATTLGTLPFAHLARGAFVAVSLLRGAEAQGVLSSAAVTGFLGTLRTVSHDLTEDARAVAEGSMAWSALVRRWGHLRPGTYDVTSPRYDADAERFLRPLVDEAARAEPGTDDTQGHGAWVAERAGFAASLTHIGLDVDVEHLERFLRGAIEGREWAKFTFSRSLSDALELLAQGWEARGVGRVELGEVPLALLVPDRAGALPSATAVTERAAAGAAARAVTRVLELAPLLVDEADLDAFVLTADTPNFVGTTVVHAPIVVLDGDGPPSAGLAGRIVLIPRADPGFDWIFGHRPAGLVTLYGGANSHMAIRAAEFGLAAAIGVGEQRYRSLATATAAELDPAGRTLRPLR